MLFDKCKWELLCLINKYLNVDRQNISEKVKEYHFEHLMSTYW